MSTDGYAQWSNSLYRNEKMCQFAEEQPRAFALWGFSISYCSDQLTDGFVSVFASKRFLSARKREINALEKSGLWEKTEGGWNVHDYLEWQNSSEKITKKRDAAMKRQRKHRGDSTDSPDSVTPSVTRDTERDNPGDVTESVTSMSRPQNLKPKTKQKEREEKKSSPSDDVFDWRTALEAWKPNPSHYQTARDQLEKGYELVDIPQIEQDFRLSVLSKSNKYDYRDFDAAFTNWILKRSRDQKPMDPAAKGKTPGGREITEAQIQRVLTPIDLSYPDLDYVTKRKAVIDALKQTKSLNTAAQIAGAMLDQAWVEMGS
jgi:hypothetical protein